MHYYRYLSRQCWHTEYWWGLIHCGFGNCSRNWHRYIVWVPWKLWVLSAKYRRKQFSLGCTHLKSVRPAPESVRTRFICFLLGPVLMHLAILENLSSEKKFGGIITRSHVFIKGNQGSNKLFHAVVPLKCSLKLKRTQATRTVSQEIRSFMLL